MIQEFSKWIRLESKEEDMKKIKDFEQRFNQEIEKELYELTEVDNK